MVTPNPVTLTQSILDLLDGLLPAGQSAADILAVTAALPGNNQELMDAAKRLCDNFATPVLQYSLLGRWCIALAKAYPECEEAQALKRKVLSL